MADLPVPLGRPGDDGSGRAPRWAKFVGYAARHPWDLIRLANLRHWSERTVIALVMQTRDNSITVRLRRGVFGRGLRAGRGHGEPSPTWIPAAHEATRMLAEETANLGVNPSLTITAQAERAMSLWPNRGEADPRPPLGSAYRRLSPVAPKNPAVPASAAGALRLPIVDIT